MRYARSVACASTAGFHQRSKCTTWAALVRLRPVPAAFSDSRNTGTPPSWKRRTISSRRATGVPPCSSCVGTPRAARCVSSSRAIRTYCVNTSTPASSSARIVSSSSSRSSTFPERPAIRGRCLLQELRGVVADLLEGRQQLDHQAAPREALRRRDLAPAPRAPPPRTARPVPWSVPPRGRSSSSAAARARCPGPTCGGAAGRGGRAGPAGRRRPGPSPPSTAMAYCLRKRPSGPSRPGVVQSRTAHSSDRLFSTGVPVSATRAPAGRVRSALAVAENGFFTCWASSATTQRPPGAGGEFRRRPAASCRTW
ncbi:hypothetical protein SRIMM317S_05615 [Streptomyces rimosus subsp. rimosus]